MNLTQTSTTELMRKRALALASMYLTRRDGAVVQESEPGTGINLVLTLPPGARPGLRQLGVSLRYVLEPVTADHADKVLRPSWPVPDYGPFPFPVALFFFTMRDNGAWSAWVAEPVVTSDGRAQLLLRDRPDCQPLTDESLEGLLDRVDSWYDAQYASSTAGPSGGKRPKRS